MRARKVVVPAAGLGTRFLPATRVVPKELMPIVDTPLIMRTVEEAVAAGMEEVVLVLDPSRYTLLTTFAPDPELGAELRARGKVALAERVEKAPPIRLTVRTQVQPLGLGHAVLQARDAIGDEPFAVMLPDELYLAPRPPIGQLCDLAVEHGASVIAVEEVPVDRISSYGVIRPGARRGAVHEVADLVEKPPAAQAPSRLAVVGRYLLLPEVFEALARTTPGQGGEIQLTDALRDLAARGRLFAAPIDGRRYDAGTPHGLIVAGAAFALDRGGPEAAGLRAALQALLDR